MGKNGNKSSVDILVLEFYQLLIYFYVMYYIFNWDKHTLLIIDAYTIMLLM